MNFSIILSFPKFQNAFANWKFFKNFPKFCKIKIRKNIKIILLFSFSESFSFPATFQFQNILNSFYLWFLHVSTKNGLG